MRIPVLSSPLAPVRMSQFPRQRPASSAGDSKVGSQGTVANLRGWPARYVAGRLLDRNPRSNGELFDWSFRPHDPACSAT